jgi:hypothetical protein
LCLLRFRQVRIALRSCDRRDGGRFDVLINLKEKKKTFSFFRFVACSGYGF